MVDIKTLGVIPRAAIAECMGEFYVLPRVFFFWKTNHQSGPGALKCFFIIDGQ